MGSATFLNEPTTPHASLVRTARTTGLFYLALAITGGLGFLIVRPALFDPDDSSAMLAQLLLNERLARTGVALESWMIGYLLVRGVTRQAGSRAIGEI